MKNTNSDRTAIMLRLLTIAFIMVIMNSCAIIDKLSNDNSDFFDEVGFFSDDNKPDDYQLWNTYFPQSFVTVNDHDDGGSGEEWANLQTELKIRENAVYNGFNGVILGRLSHYTRLQGEKYAPYSITYYNRYYIPIIYDQDKYQAPLTEYQKKQLNKKNKRKARKDI